MRSCWHLVQSPSVVLQLWHNVPRAGPMQTNGGNHIPDPGRKRLPAARLCLSSCLLLNLCSLPTYPGASAPGRKHHSLWPGSLGSILTRRLGRPNPRAEGVFQTSGRSFAGYVVSWRMQWHQ